MGDERPVRAGGVIFPAVVSDVRAGAFLGKRGVRGRQTISGKRGIMAQVETSQWLLTPVEMADAIGVPTDLFSEELWGALGKQNRAQLRKVAERIKREQTPVVGWSTDEHGVTHAATLNREQWQQLSKEAGLEGQ